MSYMTAIQSYFKQGNDHCASFIIKLFENYFKAQFIIMERNFSIRSIFHEQKHIIPSNKKEIYIQKLWINNKRY
jgi:hypothetical protein